MNNLPSHIPTEEAFRLLDEITKRDDLLTDARQREKIYDALITRYTTLVQVLVRDGRAQPFTMPMLLETAS